jgi:hypothetical protein
MQSTNPLLTPLNAEGSDEPEYGGRMNTERGIKLLKEENDYLGMLGAVLTYLGCLFPPVCTAIIIAMDVWMELCS